MPLAPMSEVVGGLAGARRGLGAFNAIQLEQAEAIVAGAERAGSPVVLQVSENCVAYHGALAPLGRAVLEVGRAAAVPVVVHLDHATSADLVREAVALGFGSVMFDASRLDHDANVAATAEVAARCHADGVWVEAELGEIGGKDGAHAPHARTDPAEAASYVAATGVDALAVAVGTSHAMPTRDGVLDLPLIARLRAAVPVPLVLHGSSGVPDAALGAAVGHGMTKINIATQLNKVYTAAVRDRLAADPALVDPRRYVAAGRDAVAAEVARLLAVIQAPGLPCR
ncbi:class II fructose-bisphosphate aldolase [Actinomadura syzygii]|uniref:Class II fructose-bisphosphate aldolase n=1 Tax=Actinomadura syzygii TaxID=1427538 RepID=A0A5D0TTL4_9ACTN|nr:class II fructose-bisphosphate aldolase [Actinomadura syzygii]TYC09063.1 class II fructose-bisphosphate aldolase [Actinomadura syzygii]